MAKPRRSIYSGPEPVPYVDLSSSDVPNATEPPSGSSVPDPAGQDGKFLSVDGDEYALVEVPSGGGGGGGATHTIYLTKGADSVPAPGEITAWGSVLVVNAAGVAVTPEGDFTLGGAAWDDTDKALTLDSGIWAVTWTGYVQVYDTITDPVQMSSGVTMSTNFYGSDQALCATTHIDNLAPSTNGSITGPFTGLVNATVFPQDAAPASIGYNLVVRLTKVS